MLKVEINLCDVCNLGSDESNDFTNYLFNYLDECNLSYELGQVGYTIYGTIDYGDKAITLVKADLKELLNDDPYVNNFTLNTVY